MTSTEADELLGKKEPAFDDLENSRPLQIMCSGTRAKGVTGKPFAKEAEMHDSWIQTTFSADIRNRDQ